MVAESRGVVLVVDDDEAGRCAAVRTLQQAGFQALEGASGQDAFRLLRQNPDVLVLDLHLSGANGIEVCRRLKEDPQTARVPILRVSAEFIAPEDGRRALESGADAYLKQPADPEALVAMVQALARARRVREEEEQLATNDERTRAAEVKRLEASLREARKMESVGLLAGGFAHDLNNLLTGILGNASIVQESLGRDHPVRPQLDTVVEASERAAELVGRLLALAGKGKFVAEPLDLSRFVRDNIGLIRASIPAALDLATDLAPDLPPVRGDSSQLRRLLASLVIGAVERTGECEGTIFVRTGLQRAGSARPRKAEGERIEPGEHVYLEVSNGGSGSVEANTDRGLGLSAARGIADRHHGAIEIRSAPGGRTVFRALFPAAAPEQTVPRPATVLVGDADQFVRQMTRAVLERQGYAVLLAVDVPEALSKFERHAAAIVAVVLDASLPEPGASELLDRLRSIRPDVGVIVTSGRPACEVLAQFPPAHAPAFLQKPYTARQIAELVRRTTQSSLAAGASG